MKTFSVNIISFSVNIISVNIKRFLFPACDRKRFHYPLQRMAALALTLATTVSHAGPLNLAQNDLGLTLGVEPNIMILSDDSGSMDYGLLIKGANDGAFNNRSSIMQTQGETYFYTYKGPDFKTGEKVLPPAADFMTVLNTLFRYNANLHAPTEAALQDAGVAAPYLGIWRLWSSAYNLLHYDPNTTYRPWAGLDSTGKPYANADKQKALFNPYRPGHGSLDLTKSYSYQTECGFEACRKVNKDKTPPVLENRVTISGNNADADGVGVDISKKPIAKVGKRLSLTVNIFPARYYDWTDSNSNNTVDADDGHTLVEIKPATSTYKRKKFSEETGSGRSDCGNTADKDGNVTCSYAQEIQNFANWFSYYRKRDLVNKAAFSNVISTANFARIGYVNLNNDYSLFKVTEKGATDPKPDDVNKPLASMNLSPTEGNKKALLDSIFKSGPGGGTNTRLRFEQLGNYFECKTDNTFDYKDKLQPGQANCPVEAAPKGTCQVNYALIVTDGYYNTSPGTEATGPSKNNTDGPGAGNTNFDGGAFADDFANTLADIAMHFYERDLHPTLEDNVPVSARDVNRFNGPAASPLKATDTLHQRLVTYGIGFGVDGTLDSIPASPSAAFTWPEVVSDPNKIDDLRHAAYNGRGDFINARDPRALQESINEVFNQFLAGPDSSSAVAFNRRSLRTDSVVFRAFFDSSNNSGDLVAQKINDQGELNTNAEGKPVYEWQAAKELDGRFSDNKSDDRIIVTYNDTGDNKSGGVDFQWASLNTAQQAYLNQSPVTNKTDSLGEKRLGYLRGHSENEGLDGAGGKFRPRKMQAGKLGDIVHSAPVYVAQPESINRDAGAFPGEFPGTAQTRAKLYSTFKNSNRARKPVVYVGANDGMLHAFEAASGRELFAYVPNLLFEHLADLTDPDYVHRFYVNQTPSINDVFMKKRGASTRAWNSVLVSGVGAGGKGYFALNITDPGTFTPSGMKNNVMWEFTDQDDADLGYSLGEPLIAMSNAEHSDGDKRWVAIFGNGYNSTSTDGDAAIYIAFLEAGLDGVWTTGTDYIKISTANGKAESADKTTPNGIGGLRGIDIDEKWHG